MRTTRQDHSFWRAAHPALSAFLALTMWAIPPWIVVIAGGVVASGVAALGFPL